MTSHFKSWFKSGTPWIWLTAGAVSASLVMVLGILLLVAVNGLAHFWPASVWEFDVTSSNGEITKIMGEIRDEESIGVVRLRDAGIIIPDDAGDFITRYLIKTGNRDVTGLDFRWLVEPSIAGAYETTTSCCYGAS